MARRSKRKRDQDRKSKPKRARLRLNKNADSKPIGKSRLRPFSLLANVHDNLVIERLATAAFGELAMDRLVLDPPQTVPALRVVLRQVYFKAANARQLSKATKNQLKNAKSALSQLTRAVVNLEKVSTDGRNGLRMLLEGSPLDDEKGERELNELASACWKIRLDVAPAGLALQSAIKTEEISNPMLASGASGLEPWSTLSLTGGSPSEGRSLRPSTPIGEMMRLQSCMAVVDIS